jgi:hypothetical protein
MKSTVTNNRFHREGVFFARLPTYVAAREAYFRHLAEEYYLSMDVRWND